MYVILFSAVSLCTLNTENGMPIKFNYKVSILINMLRTHVSINMLFAIVSYSSMLFIYKTIVVCTLSLLVVSMTSTKSYIR